MRKLKDRKPKHERMGFESQKDFEDYISGYRAVGTNLCGEMKSKHEKNKNNPDSLFYDSSFLKEFTYCETENEVKTMKIDRKVVGMRCHIGLRPEYVETTSFKPGDDVVIIFEKDKITVTKEVAGVVMTPDENEKEK